MTTGDPADLPTIPYDLDDDLLEAVRAAQVPRIRVRPWTGGPAVVMGRGGRQALELHRTAIAADGVPVYRRPGGGCAVVLDSGNLTVAVGLPRPGVGGITAAFGTISDWLTAGLANCGLRGVVQEGTSDLVRHGRKIGGSCIWRARGLIYYSTTLLVAPDQDLVSRYLHHPPREPAYRAGRSHREFMGRLDDPDGSVSTVKLATQLEVVLVENLTALDL